MPGPAGYSAPVHSAGDQLGDHEVAQVVQPAAHAEAAGEPLEAVGDAVGVDRLGPVGDVGEHIGVGRQGGPASEGVLGLGDPAGAQQLDGAGPDGDPALGMGLGVLVDQRLPGNANDVAGNQDLTTIQVDIGPTKTDDLAATGAEHDGEAQEQPQ